MVDTAAEIPAGGTRPRVADTLDLSALQRAVVLTVIYSDLFDYPLTEAELHRYLVLVPTDRARLRAAVTSLSNRYLEEGNGYIFLAGRSELAELRRRRNELAERRWATASRFGRWLARVPFVRLVGVCGSQAALNPGPGSDVDFFCITASSRLWVVQICAMALRRVASLFSIRVCPNYFLTSDNLEIEKKNVYQAREVSQAIPLHGSVAYEQFLDANCWLPEFLPNLMLDDRRQRLSDIEQPAISRWCERILGGRLGALLDASLYQVLLAYYSVRLRHHGWRKEDIRKAYRRDCQRVMQGGYGEPVKERFQEKAGQILGADLIASDLAKLFPDASLGTSTADPLYSGLFSQRYGGQDG